MALVLPEPSRTEVDALRLATGGDVDRIVPHITLVPPVNVADGALGDALALVRAAAGDVAPLRLTVGPAATFAPVNRVLYLAVDGSASTVAALLGLRSALLAGVLHRPDHRPFVPHVTLTSHLPEGDDDGALRLLGGYRRIVEVDRVDLLGYDEEDRRWSTLADVVLGAGRVVGRGGVELELTTSSRLDPEAAAFVREVAAGRSPGADDAVLWDRAAPVVVAARREGTVVGVAVGDLVGRGDRRFGRVAGVVVAVAERRMGIGGHLLAGLSFELSRRGAVRLVAADDIDREVRGLLEARGWSAASRAHLERPPDPQP